MGKKGINVVRRDRGWAVVRDGAGRAIRVFDTQQRAIEHARPIAQRDQAELRIQGRDTRWRSVDSYGNDPVDHRDMEH